MVLKCTWLNRSFVELGQIFAGLGNYDKEPHEIKERSRLEIDGVRHSRTAPNFDVLGNARLNEHIRWMLYPSWVQDFMQVNCELVCISTTISFESSVMVCMRALIRCGSRHWPLIKLDPKIREVEGCSLNESQVRVRDLRNVVQPLDVDAKRSCSCAHLGCPGRIVLARDSPVCTSLWSELKLHRGLLL